MENFCKSLPKIELHAHLNGSLSKTTLLSLGCGDENIKQYQKLTELLNKNARTLDECFQLFQVAHDATNNVDAVYKATESVIKEFHDDNCIYLELRTTPREEKQMTRTEYVATVVRAIENCKNKWPIVVQLILCLNREWNGDTNKEVMNLIIAMHNQHPDIVVGVDLCGNPKVGHFNDSKCEFVRARNAGLKVTLHCAEVKSNEEELEMLGFGPDRLGHGTFLYSLDSKQEAFQIVKQKKIPLEICLSSNVVTGTVENFHGHHLKQWLEHELPFCLCTDDKGVFACDLPTEYLQAHRHHGLGALELFNVSYKSVDYIFANGNHIKKHLIDVLDEWKLRNMHEFA